MQSVNGQLFLANTKGLTIGVRVDQILSFTYREAEMTLAIRYLNDIDPETFEGPIAEALFQELRFGGRR